LIEAKFSVNERKYRGEVSIRIIRIPMRIINMNADAKKMSVVTIMKSAPPR
jgi:hypothetical protein